MSNKFLPAFILAVFVTVITWVNDEGFGIIIMLISTIILSIYFAILQDRARRTRLKNIEDILNKEIQFLCSEKNILPNVLLKSHNFQQAVLYDKVRKNVYFIESCGERSQYDIDEILCVDIVIDGVQITSTSAVDTVGRALIGGVVAGGVGAIVGGSTSKKSSKNQVNKVEVKFTIADEDIYIKRIPVFEREREIVTEEMIRSYIENAEIFRLNLTTKRQ
ncbi:hypothetical protein CBW65_13840 [Tumebacillus avium]|uniref:Uncharacterized protein n=1 Tax=Tumebacillus avium TaxID=1903704 RepID=A0A1Y0IRH7_9BACL|nr:hypothetical protein [Tumebacillus avium]ARU61964.1 hypothetical protein CBW65_13840 [Tumebacillus avium]